MQQSRLVAVVRRYNAKTKGSKKVTQDNRAVMADPRAVTGFRPAMVTIVIGCLAAGSALLAPAIVIGYGVKAADRADRGEPDGH